MFLFYDKHYNLIKIDDWSNPRSDDPGQKHKAHDVKFRGPLWAWAFVELFSTVNIIRTILKPSLKFSTLEKYCAMASLGIANGGLGITVREWRGVVYMRCDSLYDEA